MRALSRQSHFVSKRGLDLFSRQFSENVQTDVS